ncbi:hypothetical protein R3W88_030356 [Solanum pinnatisectum]|uniref:Uncharacterized protein n=1 Tax=Solanum pinnatisectum TaxID=50273 RepID=A0AAV9K8B8_9SOLN|nr:hypothetical protein R3W88_030356 [Solanum pinnatisectum]
MHEEYLTNEDGLMVSNSTWKYKIPTIDTIPQNFNVHLLNSGHHQKRVLSSKVQCHQHIQCLLNINLITLFAASGELPLLLAASVHCATRATVKAAREQLKLWGNLYGSVSEFYLDIPAIIPIVKTQCGLDYVEKYLESILA